MRIRCFFEAELVEWQTDDSETQIFQAAKMKKRDVYIAVGIVAAGLLALLVLDSKKGLIALDCPGAEMVLASGVFGTTDLRPEDGAVEVKARAYRATQLQITAKDGNDTWRIYADRPWGQLQTIKVLPGKTTRIKCGPPFTVRADVRQLRGIVSVDYSIVGQAGENYARILKNGRPQGEPTVEILNDKGEKIGGGKFSYG